MNDNKLGAVLTFVLGVGVGAAAGILLAPKAGEDLRADIANTVSDGVKQARRTGKQLKRQAQELMGVAKSQARDAIDTADEMYGQVKEA